MPLISSKKWPNSIKGCHEILEAFEFVSSQQEVRIQDLEAELEKVKNENINRMYKASRTDEQLKELRSELEIARAKLVAYFNEVGDLSDFEQEESVQPAGGDNDPFDAAVAEETARFRRLLREAKAELRESKFEEIVNGPVTRSQRVGVSFLRREGYMVKYKGSNEETFVPTTSLTKQVPLTLQLFKEQVEAEDNGEEEQEEDEEEQADEVQSSSSKKRKERDWRCDTCSLTFKSERNLLQHRKSKSHKTREKQMNKKKRKK